MKQIISLSLILFSLLVINQSCSKEMFNDVVVSAPDQTINANVSADNAYILNIGNLGDVKVSRQAVHFATSQTEIDAKDRTPVYKYVPAAGYIGNDEVELVSSKTYNTNSGACNGGGGRHSTTVTSIVIKLTITK